MSIVEAGEHNSEIADLAIKRYISFFLDKNLGTLILGCTHYGLLEKKIRKILGPKVHLISEGRIVAEKLVDYFIRHPEIESKLSRGGSVKFLTTDLTNKFQVLGSRFFGKKIKAEQINLD